MRYLLIATLALGLGSAGLGGCASMDLDGSQAASRKAPQQVIRIGQTTKAEVARSMGEAAAKATFDSGGEVWVYSEKPGAPLLVSFIPVVGDIADVIEMAGSRHELTILFDRGGVVRQYKSRAAE